MNAEMIRSNFRFRDNVTGEELEAFSEFSFNTDSGIRVHFFKPGKYVFVNNLFVESQPATFIDAAYFIDPTRERVYGNSVLTDFYRTKRQHSISVLKSEEFLDDCVFSIHSRCGRFFICKGIYFPRLKSELQSFSEITTVFTLHFYSAEDVIGTVLNDSSSPYILREDQLRDIFLNLINKNDHNLQVSDRVFSFDRSGRNGNDA